MPPSLALACVATTWGGLALALMLGERAARHPRDLFWLMADGAGLAPTLLLVRTLELPSRGIHLPFSTETLYLVIVTGVLSSAAWLAFMSMLRFRRNKPLPGTGALLAAGCSWSYLVLPMLHYALNRPGYNYITDATNVFALSPFIQLTTWGTAGGIALGITRLRKVTKKSSAVVHKTCYN